MVVLAFALSPGRETKFLHEVNLTVLELARSASKVKLQQNFEVGTGFFRAAQVEPINTKSGMDRYPSNELAGVYFGQRFTTQYNVSGAIADVTIILARENNCWLALARSGSVLGVQLVSSSG